MLLSLELQAPPAPSLPAPLGLTHICTHLHMHSAHTDSHSPLTLTDTHAYTPKYVHIYSHTHVHTVTHVHT